MIFSDLKSEICSFVKELFGGSVKSWSYIVEFLCGSAEIWEKIAKYFVGCFWSNWEVLVDLT